MWTHLNSSYKIKQLLSTQKFLAPFDSTKVKEMWRLDLQEIHSKTDTEESAEQLRYWIEKEIVALFDFK